MASEIRAKTQTLSLRLDPKTRFLLEFMSRVRGQSITTIVERAIKDAAEKTGIGPTIDHRGNELYQALWSDFWDPDEGVRILKLIASKDYTTNYDEDEIRRFTIDHWEFFYTTTGYDIPVRHFVGVLWPQILTYVRIWRETKNEDYWAAGKKMSEDLTRAKLQPPKWPRPMKSAEPKKPSSFARDLDDEVPF